MPTIRPSLTLSLAASLVASFPVAAAVDKDDLSPLWLSLDLGAGLGLTQDDYQQQAGDAGLGVTLNNANDPRLAWKIGAGWDLWQAPKAPVTLATQIEWFDLGPVDVSYSGSVNQSQLENLYDELENIHPESGSGLAFGFSGRWQGFERERLRPLSLGAELGATYWWQTYELNGQNGDVVRTDETSGAGWYAGLQSDYALMPQWRLRSGWRVYGLDTETVQTFSLGVSYQFKAPRRDKRPDFVPDSEAVPEPMPTPLPMGRADKYNVDQAGTGQFNVLANDINSDDKPLRVVWVEGSQAGRLAISDDGKRVQYQHDGGADDQDAFQYWFTNGEQDVGPVNVDIRIRPVTPSAVDDQFQVGYQAVSRLEVLANDTDPNQAELTITRINHPDHGQVEIINNILVYSHTGTASGSDRLEYWISNGQIETGPATVELDILPAALTIPIRFSPGASELPSDDEPLLNRLAQWLNDNPDASLIIAGHTDSSGDAVFNQELSEQRARTVMNYLISQNIAEQRLSAIGYGDQQPLADNDTAAGQALNRRVEVRLE